MKVIVTAGYNQSLHSIALMQELKDRGHEVAGCLIVKTFQLKRLSIYLRLYGIDVVKKKFKSLILGSKGADLSNETKHIRGFVDQKKITARKVSAWCKENNVPFKSVASLNTEEAVNFTKSQDVDFVIYSGGGILRKNIIKAPNVGVLNAHSGWLPFFRGMNVIEWSLLYGVKPQTTIHFINVGIDTGEILYSEEIPFDPSYDLYDLRGRATLHNIELLTKVIDNFDHYYENKRPQTKKEGKQFFVMHPRLKSIVAEKLQRDQLPKQAANIEPEHYNFS